MTRTYKIFIIGADKHGVEVVVGIEGKLSLIVPLLISPAPQVSVTDDNSLVRARVKVESAIFIVWVTGKVHTKAVII